MRIDRELKEDGNVYDVIYSNGVMPLATGVGIEKLGIAGCASTSCAHASHDPASMMYKYSAITFSRLSECLLYVRTDAGISLVEFYEPDAAYRDEFKKIVTDNEEALDLLTRHLSHWSYFSREAMKKALKEMASKTFVIGKRFMDIMGQHQAEAVLMTEYLKIMLPGARPDMVNELEHQVEKTLSKTFYPFELNGVLYRPINIEDEWGDWIALKIEKEENGIRYHVERGMFNNTWDWVK